MTCQLGKTFFILDEKNNIIPNKNIEEFRKWSDENKEKLQIETFIGDFRISTIFMGRNHDNFHEGEPLLWETMIFKNKEVFEDYQKRYSSFKEAMNGHNEAIDKIEIIFNERHERKENKMRDLTKEELVTLIKNEVNLMAENAFRDKIDIVYQYKKAKRILKYVDELEQIKDDFLKCSIPINENVLTNKK